MIITITGKPGSGKTTASQFFNKFNANIINADKLGHEIIRTLDFKSKLKKLFPNLKLLTRKAIADYVFKSKENLQKYDVLIHPILINEIRSRIKKDTLNIIDAALVCELKLDKISDKIILIKTKQELIAKRISPEIAQRGVYQKPVPDPDYTIENNSTITHMHNSLRSICAKLELD